MIKEKLVTEAEGLASSTDWGPTTGAYRDLMARWKAAGPAPRDVDELLWKKFRGAQDRFFMAKQAALSEQDSELRVNAQAKERLLAEAEALLTQFEIEMGLKTPQTAEIAEQPKQLGRETTTQS